MQPSTRRGFGEGGPKTEGQRPGCPRGAGPKLSTSLERGRGWPVRCGQGSGPIGRSTVRLWGRHSQGGRVQA